MAVERKYRCNLCREELRTEPGGDPAKKPIGLHWNSWPKGWTEKPWRETENHICIACLSSLQVLTQRCGDGYECDGGPQCSSDHK